MPKILIAEDNELNLKLMYDLLVANGYNVNCVTDGAQAVAELSSKNYDLLILDLQMPKLSGFEVLKFIQEKKISTKILVVSACAMASEIEKAKELGCEEFITKPIRINEFINAVKRYSG